MPALQMHLSLAKRSNIGHSVITKIDVLKFDPLFNIFRWCFPSGPILSVVMEVRGVDSQYFWTESFVSLEQSVK
jgi:hypothetical protein